MGIVASGDEGWNAFAADSGYLYCVKSIDELTELFEATGVHADAIKNRMLAVIQDPESALRAQLTDALNEHVVHAVWRADDVYSGVVPRVEAEAYDASTISYELFRDLTKVWNAEDDPDTWVIEVTALVKAEVSINLTFYVFDSIDREEIELGSESTTREVEIEVQAFLNCSGVQADTGPELWSVDIEIAPSDYDVEVGEVEPNFSDH